MSNSLERDLVQTKKSLSGLIKDTRAAISSVAIHGYQELNKLPAATTQPMDTSLPPHHGINRYFPRIIIGRIAEVPTRENPVILGDSHILVSGINTETIRRQHYHKGRIAFRLSVQERSVQVEFSNPDEQRAMPHKISVFDNGYVAYDAEPAYTYPTADDHSRLTSPNGGYSSPDHLVRNYSFAFQGSIGTTLFVAESLSQIHGIQSDMSELSKLQTAWQRRIPQEMHQNIAVLLPRKPL